MHWQCLHKKDKRSITTLLARQPKGDVVSALPLTFAARLRHAEVSLQEATEANTISPFYVGVVLLWLEFACQ